MPRKKTLGEASGFRFCHLLFHGSIIDETYYLWKGILFVKNELLKFLLPSSPTCCQVEIRKDLRKHNCDKPNLASNVE